MSCRFCNNKPKYEHEIITIETCEHVICLECLSNLIGFNNNNINVKCPFQNKNFKCHAELQTSEINKIRKFMIGRESNARQPNIPKQDVPKPSVSSVPKNHTKPQDNDIFESNEIFKCKTLNCQGIWLIEGNMNLYQCPLCNHYNCVDCKVI